MRKLYRKLDKNLKTIKSTSMKGLNEKKSVIQDFYINHSNNLSDETLFKRKIYLINKVEFNNNHNVSLLITVLFGVAITLCQIYYNEFKTGIIDMFDKKLSSKGYEIEYLKSIEGGEEILKIISKTKFEIWGLLAISIAIILLVFGLLYLLYYINHKNEIRKSIILKYEIEIIEDILNNYNNKNNVFVRFSNGSNELIYKLIEVRNNSI